MEIFSQLLGFLPPDTQETVSTVLTVFSSLWWLWVFIFFFVLAQAAWLAWRQIMFKSKIQWTLLELRVPREVRKSPQAMEQVFAAIHSIRNAPGNFKEKWWDGEITRWFSCEMVSLGGEIHMYVRVPKVHQNIIEASLYSQYSDMELVEVPGDYINRMPPTFEKLTEAGYRMFGSELKLEKEDVYPIRTYVDFETMDEEKQLDPVSAVLEMISKIKPQETVWIQILFFPIMDEWKKAGEEVVKKLKEKSRQQIQSPQGAVVWTMPSPGETELLKSIENNIAKPGFDTLLRYIYIASGEVYDQNYGQRGIFSTFNQYASERTNRFKHNIYAWTRANMWYYPYIFPKQRLLARHQRIYKDYRNREIRDETWMEKVLNIKFFHWGIKGQEFGKFIFSTEELATIFHLPTIAVLTGPLIKRSESRRVGPPAGLAIYGDDEKNLPGIK